MFSSLMMTCFISPTNSPSYLDLQKANVICHFHPNVYYHPLNQPVNLIWGFHNLFLISIFQINIQIWVCCSQNILTWCFKKTNVSLFDYSSLLLYLSLMPGRLMNSSYF